jgi:hypothetical protein
MVDHLATEYKGRRIATHSEVNFGKIEFIKMMRKFASEIAEQQELEKGTTETIRELAREREPWEGLRFAKNFADRIWEQKRMGKRIRL